MLTSPSLLTTRRRYRVPAFIALALALAVAAPCTRAAAQTPADTGFTLARIFTPGALPTAPMPDPRWLPDGDSYIDIRANPAGGSDIIKVSALKGDTTVVASAQVLVGDGKPLAIEGLQLSADGTKALIYHNSVRVWRQNTRGRYHVLDLATKKLTPLSSAAGLQMFAKFSPDSRQVAFVRDNNLFATDLATGKERALTSDGSETIINGTSDWVYEEELDVRDAFRWSPDSKRVAYWHFDQSPVPPYPMVDQLPPTPRVLPLRYPKVGDPNSHVKVGVVDVAGSQTTWMQTGADTLYIAAVEWVDKDSLTIQRLPRWQNEIALLMASAATGGTRTILTERDSAWLRVDTGTPRWVAKKSMFLWPSASTGWDRYVLYRRDGTLVRQVTPSGVDAAAIAGVDEKRQIVYVTEASPTPMQRQLFAYSYAATSQGTRVTRDAGTHRVDVSPGAKWAVDRFSTVATPPTVSLLALPASTTKRVLQPNNALRSFVAANTTAPTFFQVPMPDGEKLNAWRITPAGFDSTRRYPVLMYVYGGPGSQTVTDDYGGDRYLWHQYLAKQGYVVVSVDNRGTGARGRAFERSVYERLGELESRDQIDAAKWLGTQRWTDPDRIAIWGWSYGGYMASLTAFKGGPIFRSAIAVAPVTDWRLYDNIYTERYMRTAQDNPNGYATSAPQAYVSGLSAQFLLVHGTGDDNVHPQNSIQLADKLQAANKQFDFMLYPNRTHSISGGPTRVHLFTMLTRFLDRTMGVPDEATPPATSAAQGATTP